MEGEGVIHTRVNKQLEFNWGVVNVPTIVGLLSIIGMIWAQSAERAKKDTDFELRIANIEKNEAQNRAINEAVPNIQYRLTAQETLAGATNNRIDRGFDAIDDVRKDIGGLSTKIEVLTQRIEMVLPRTELDGIPRELRGTTGSTTR